MDKLVIGGIVICFCLILVIGTIHYFSKKNGGMEVVEEPEEVVTRDQVELPVATEDQGKITEVFVEAFKEKGHDKAPVPDTTTCPRCGSPALKNYVCGACDYRRDIK